MKRITWVFFNVVGMITGFAQPYIDWQSAPVPGTSFHMHVGTYYNLPQTGQDQVWDYSIAGGGGGWTFQFNDATSDPASDQFPDAELVMTGNGSSNFYEADNSGLYTYGYTGPFGSYVYSDPRKMVKYPMMYGTSWTDPFAASSLTNTSTFNGTTTCVANGHGTLVLPWGSVNDVLRVRCTTIVDMSSGAQHVDSVTLFYHENFPWHLLKATRQITYQNGQPLPQNWSLEYAAQQSVMEIQQLNGQAPTVVVFPSPAIDIVNIRSKHTLTSISIMDETGRILLSLNVDGSWQYDITVSDLSEGIYLLGCTKESGDTSYSKVIVQR
jgi:hypothetical protein